MSHVTLNIGDKVEGQFVRLQHREVMAACRKHGVCPEFVRYIPGATRIAEGTWVIQAKAPKVWSSHVLAEELQQECIAVRTASGGYLSGPNTSKYGEFDIKKFITKEQAMSYGSPAKPDGRAETEQELKDRAHKALHTGHNARLTKLEEQLAVQAKLNADLDKRLLDAEKRHHELRKMLLTIAYGGPAGTSEEKAYFKGYRDGRSAHLLNP